MRIHFFAPAVLGSVFQAVLAGYKVICIIDAIRQRPVGVAQGDPVCLEKWHSGLWRVQHGALRAAELHAYGMDRKLVGLSGLSPRRAARR
jgi:hypothetical protein